MLHNGSPKSFKNAKEAEQYMLDTVREMNALDRNTKLKSSYPNEKDLMGIKAIHVWSSDELNQVETFTVLAEV
jgi:hypothetical protein